MGERLYRQVAEGLRRRIGAGEWAVGAQLPTELDLSASLQVSRTTIRQALDELESQGLVERRKRHGTRVTAREPDSMFRMVTSNVEQVLGLARDSVLDVVSTTSVADDTLVMLEGFRSETGHWLQVCGTRRFERDSEALPFSWSWIYVTGRYAGIEPAIGKRLPSVYGAIEQAFGISVTRVDQRVGAVPCPSSVARAIGLTPRAPVLEIVATLHDARDGVIERTRTLFDPARFQICTDVRIE